ncbi:MAG: hypothetical protein ABJG78_01155 [Cyclobacteriaceae bacterium]
MLQVVMVSETQKSEIGSQTTLQLFRERNGSSIHVDKRTGIVKITWVEIVDQETAMEIIQTLVKLMNSGIFFKILMARDHSTRFTDEANAWMRNFLLTNRYKFNYKISRIAGVTPDALRANVFSNFMKTALQVIFPGIKISNFEFEESAIAWLT